MKFEAVNKETFPCKSPLCDIQERNEMYFPLNFCAQCMFHERDV